MVRASDAAEQELFDDPVAALAELSDFIRSRGLAAHGMRAKEVVRTFGDGFSFLECSAWQTGDRMRVLLEFGAQDSDARGTVGVLAAHWVPTGAGGELARIESVLLGGSPVGVGRFCRAARPYLALGLMATDLVGADEA